VLLETDLSASAVYSQAIAEIEQRLGRVRDPRDKNAARTIDIDLSLFNRDILVVAGHSIPDPEIAQRPFVVIPLAELEPDYIHPIDHRRLADIAAGWTSNSGLQPRADVKLQ
jgi:2-amino-4-hydroxy-6-hydroxymethyldihydropteridine diphosphokinase